MQITDLQGGTDASRIAGMRWHPYFLAILTTLAPAAHAMQNASDAAVQAAPDSWPGLAQAVVFSALSLTGVQYAYGGKSPETGFDCSGFVRYVFKQAANLTLPHGARAISRLGHAVSVEQLQPGDLVFFDTLKRAYSHVGIYLGEGKFIHAPSSGGGIHVVSMHDTYWAQRFNGARRLPAASPSPAAASAE